MKPIRPTASWVVPLGDMHMRTTRNIDAQLLRRLGQPTSVHGKTQLVRLRLEALISREAAKRLARLGCTELQLTDIRRAGLPNVVILVDISVWIDHLRTNSSALRRLLDDDLVMWPPQRGHALQSRIDRSAPGNLSD